MKNGIELDFTDNPDLAEVFARKAPGEKFELRIKGQINEVTDAAMKGSIETIYVQRVKGEKEKEIEATEDEPVMAVMRGKMEGQGMGEMGEMGMMGGAAGMGKMGKMGSMGGMGNMGMMRG